MRMGGQAVALLDRPGAKPLVVVLGWVPAGTATPPMTLRAISPRMILGEVDITGYVRLPERAGWLSAPDDLAGRHFYTLDPQVIGAALGAADVAAFTLVATGRAEGLGAPQPAETLPRPPNNHLQYALTWFGLAGALVAVFVAYVARR